MASITIRNLDDGVKKRLRKQAAEHGRSLEAEVRVILDRASHDAEPQHIMNGLELFRPLREVVEKYGGVELDIPPRTPTRKLNLGFDEEPGGMDEAAAPFRRGKRTAPRRPR